MPKFPEPPTAIELRKTPPVTKELAVGTLLWRIYRRGGRHPTLWHTFRHFGPLSSRFDHHLPDTAGRPRMQKRGIFYAAQDLVTCLAETFQDTRILHRNAQDQPWVVGFELSSPLLLLDLTGVWPTRAGASMALNTGARPRARRWSQTIYDAYPQVQGLYSASSMYANRPMVSLYERALGALPHHPLVHRPLNDPALFVGLDRAAIELGYDLV